MINNLIKNKHLINISSTITTSSNNCVILFIYKNLKKNYYALKQWKNYEKNTYK